MESCITVSGLRKSYGDFEAVRGIDFEVAQGEVFGLLGPNGAGKTTTIEILEGLRTRSAGDVRVHGFVEADFFGEVGGLEADADAIFDRPHIDGGIASKRFASVTTTCGLMPSEFVSKLPICNRIGSVAATELVNALNPKNVAGLIDSKSLIENA